MKNGIFKDFFRYLFLSLIIIPTAIGKADTIPEVSVKRILFIGDSMTGWLSERLNAYGQENDFDVATIVWDGSTITQWGSTKKLNSLILEQNPDAVFISLGLNELFEPNPSKLKVYVDNICKAIGDRPMLWVGPPSWPGHDKGEILIKWLKKELGEDSFFDSFNLTLSRQSSTNPHPTREGIVKWVDAIVEWIPENSSFKLPGANRPTGNKMVRGDTFIYKRMKEQL